MKTDAGDGHLDQADAGVKIGGKAMGEADGLAGSLVELAKVDVGLDAVDRDLRLVKETVGGHMDLKKTLSDPGLPLEQKQAVVADLFRGKVADVTLNFLQLMVGMGRPELIPQVAGAFARRLEAAENKVVAEVTTAAPIDAQFSGRLAKRLSEMVGREVTLRTHVDPGLVGGIVVRIGGKLLDGSVRNQLARMREKMLTDMRGK